MTRSIGWIVATALSLAVTGFLFHFPGSFGGLPAWDVSAFIVGTIMGSLSGVLVGLAQWVALRVPRRSGGRLVLAMVIGIAGTHAVNDAAPQALGLVLVSVVGGVAMVAGFAAPLGERRPLALVTCFLAWTGGLLLAPTVTNVLGLPSSQTPLAWATEHAVDGLVVGLVWGVATAGVGLPATLREPRDREAPIVEAGATIG